MARSIVDIKNMGDALRNTGYKNIESAVSEIIDNSVEAEAKNIFIILDETINPISGRKLVRLNSIHSIGGERLSIRVWKWLTSLWKIMRRFIN